MGKLEGKIASVFVTGRRDAELATAVVEIGRTVTGIRGDVSNLGDLDRLFAQTKREKGKSISSSRMPVPQPMLLSAR